MKTIYEVNKRHASKLKISDTLNNCEILFKLDIADQGNKTVLDIQTDKELIEHAEYNQDGMMKFLKELKELCTNKDDIDELIDELSFM